jgi:iron-sulfur cluster repair protein YtfE (RIC family)
MAQQDACTLLDDDHNEVMRMFEQYKAAHDARTQQMLAAQIAQELLVHMQIEEEIFYPAFLAATGDKYRRDDGIKEHNEARELLKKIDADRQNAKLMLELEDALIHHINDEREKMFPEARAAKGMDLFKLADQLEARKSELMAAA